MARKAFNAGAEVASGEGANFKNAKVGAHSAILSGVIHLGQFEDVFTKSGIKEVKKPCNFALGIFTLMGKDDLNEDGTRIRAFKPFPIKDGAKAYMTRLLDAVDPKEVAEGFTDCIGNICSVTMTGSDELDDKGQPKYVNFGGIAAENEEMAEIIQARAEAEGLEHIGHIEFADMTVEAMKEIPAHYIRQYLLGESAGNSMNFEGSKAEEVFNTIREEDPEFAKKKAKEADDKKAAPKREEAQGTTTVPDAINQATPEDLDDEKEY